MGKSETFYLIQCECVAIDTHEYYKGWLWDIVPVTDYGMYALLTVNGNMERARSFSSKKSAEMYIRNVLSECYNLAKCTVYELTPHFQLLFQQGVKSE